MNRESGVFSPLLAKMLTGVLSVGAASCDTIEQTAKPGVESYTDATEESAHEQIAEDREEYLAIGAIDIDLIRQHLPSRMQTQSEENIRAYLKKRIGEITEEVDTRIATVRFGNPKEQEKYFSQLVNLESRKKIEQALAHMHATTGTPIDLILGMGCMETQWQTNKVNTENLTYGPLQWKFKDATEVAERMNKRYDLHLIVRSPEDLFNIELSVMLAGGMARESFDTYQDWGLAAVVHAGGALTLEHRIHERFPEIELGTKERHERSQAKHKIDIIRGVCGALRAKIQRDPKHKEVYRKALHEKEKEVIAAEAVYGECHQAEKVRRAQLGADLKRYGVSPYTLYVPPSAQKTKNVKPTDRDSVEYAIGIDTLANMGHEYLEKN